MSRTRKLYLNKLHENAENQTYESRTEATGHQHLFRAIRREVEYVAGKGGTISRTGCQCIGGNGKCRLSMGSRLEFPANIIIPTNCGTLRIKAWQRHFARRLNNFEHFSNTPIDIYLRNAKMLPVNSIGEIRITKSVLACPVELTFAEHKQGRISHVIGGAA